MPLFQLPVDTRYRIATGGLGLEGIVEAPNVLPALESRARMVSQGALGGNETWRMSSGEVGTFTVPQNETVILSDIVSLPGGGLAVIEQAALDYGTGALAAIGPATIGPAAPDYDAGGFAAEPTVTDSNKEWADAQLLDMALAQGLESGELTMLADGTIISTPPVLESPTAPQGEPEAPTTSPEGSISGEALPSEGCATVDILNFDSAGNFIGTSQEHFDGYGYSVI